MKIFEIVVRDQCFKRRPNRLLSGSVSLGKTVRDGVLCRRMCIDHVVMLLEQERLF